MGNDVYAMLAEVLFLNHSAPGSNVLQIQGTFCSSVAKGFARWAFLINCVW